VLYRRYELQFFDQSIPTKTSSFLEGSSLVHRQPDTSLLFLERWETFCTALTPLAFDHELIRLSFCRVNDVQL
jgi:hypothetical protein